mmetsp:Transcript_10340/g.29983  ORF Transcript_10340/g.29983 Transcript_10340/m.29983 type:complete len:432 (+) Transcript_10340:396-1691(+)
MELKVVEELELDLVGDGEHREVELGASVVKVVLDVWGDPVRALVEHHEAGPVVEEPCKREPLLLTGREILLPVPDIVELRTHDHTILGELQVCPVVLQHLGRHVRPPETGQDLLVRPPLCVHFLFGLGVDDHIPQGADGHKVHLRHKVDLLRGGHGDRALHERPQALEHSKERGLPTAVWARHEDTLPALYGEVQVLDEERPVGLIHRDVLESQRGALPEPRGVRAAPRCGDFILELLRPPQQAGHQSAHPARQAAESPHAVCQLEQVLNSCGHRLHVAPCRRVVRSDLICGVPVHSVQAEPERAGEEEEADNCHEVLIQVLPDDLGLEGELNGPEAVIEQIAEVLVQDSPLWLLSAREGDLLAIRDEFRMRGSEFALEVLLLRGQLAEGRQSDRGDAGCDGEPSVQGQGRRQALHAAQLHGVHEEVHDGL